jgi:hypothetical protein
MGMMALLLMLAGVLLGLSIVMAIAALRYRFVLLPICQSALPQMWRVFFCARRAGPIEPARRAHKNTRHI